MIRTPRRTRKPRHDSRTIPIPAHKDFGDGEDVGKYYRCWNCGFICNVEKNALGDSESKSGNNYTEYGMTPTNKYTGHILRGGTTPYGRSEIEALSVVCTLRTGHVILEKGYEGDTASGCPFCGTLNWRGDY